MMSNLGFKNQRIQLVYGGGGGIDIELWLLHMLPSQSTPVSQTGKYSYTGR